MRRPHASRATERKFLNCDPMGNSMKHKVSIYTLALLGALALAALAGGLLPSDNVVYAADPDFVDGISVIRNVDENTPPGVNIGAPISATDDDEDGEDNDDLEYGDTLTYSLEARFDTNLSRAEAASFDIDPSTGQLITKAALDTEGAQTSYTVTVKVEDSSGGTDTIIVTITVMNVNEPPAAPVAPTVVSGADNTNNDNEDESTTTLKVIWHEPENTGTAITDYDVEYKKTTDLEFDEWTRSGEATTATITGLETDTSYQVRVRAKSSESLDSDSKEIAPWSLVGTGSTNKADNGAPSFDEIGVGTEMTLTRRVDENEPAREEVSTEVRANAHVDDNALTYRLGGRDADLFDIDMSSGQLRTKASMNHEDPRCYVENNDNTTSCFYYVTVSVFDGQGASDARPVKIEIRDRSEAPDTPARPTVRATEKSSRSLDVSWNEPRNPGPPITGYEIRYRKGTSGSYTTVMEGDISGTSHTIAPEDGDLSDGDDRLTPQYLLRGAREGEDPGARQRMVRRDHGQDEHWQPGCDFR